MNAIGPPADAVKAKTNEVVAMVRRAESGDDTVLPQLREMLRSPHLGDTLIKLFGGDLADQARQAIVKKFNCQNIGFKESLNRKLELMLAELAGPNPTPLEKLLVDRIVSCWLHLHYQEMLFTDRDQSTEEGNYLQRNIDRAQKRYLSAIKTLAIVRKLALPTLQVNIARKQVNVAGNVIDAKSQSDRA